MPNHHPSCFDALKAAASRWLYGRCDAEAIPYTESWKGRGKKGDADLILFWKTPAILQELVRICYAHHIVMQPRGGGTSLNDSVRPPTDSEDPRPKVVLVSLYKKIELAAEDNTVIVGAGVTPHELNLFLAPHGLQVKGCDTGAKESSQFGAMFTTNTGGSTAEVEGSLLDNTLGMACITADGRMLRHMYGVQKDNSSMNLTKCIGYLHFPVVLVTDLLLKVAPLTSQRESAMIGLETLDDALYIRQFLLTYLETTLISCELMEQDALAPVFEHIPTIRNPLDRIYPYTLYLQTASALPADIFNLTSATEQLLVRLFEQGVTIAEKAMVMAMDETQKANLHAIRHHITIAAGIAANHAHAVVKGFDLSIPLSHFKTTLLELDRLRHSLLPNSQIRRFGHFLGGRLHNNIQLPADTPASVIEAYVLAVDRIIEAVGGSVASEHGAGRDLVTRLQHIRPDIYQQMLAAKQFWDPGFLIAPGVGVAVPESLLHAT